MTSEQDTEQDPPADHSLFHGLWIKVSEWWLTGIDNIMEDLGIE